MAVKDAVRNERTAAGGVLLRPLKYLSAIAMILLAMTAGAAADCEQHEALSRAASPDGKWVATFFNNICGAGMVTISFSAVELVPPDRANSLNPTSTYVFETDDFTDPKIAAVSWTGPRALQITIQNNAWIDVQESTFADVTISYKYVPDDPVERARVRREECASFKKMYEEAHQAPNAAYIALCGAQDGPKTSPQ